MDYYLDREKLLNEIILSKRQNKLTDDGKDILIELSKNIYFWYGCPTPNNRYSYALNKMISSFDKFNENISNNPFIYFSIVFKHALMIKYQEIRKKKIEFILKMK